jgi:hypothetical protein
MTRVVTTTYRYKPPSKKRKAVALEVPAVVAREGSRRLGSDKTAAEVYVKPPRLSGEATQSVAQPAAKDDRKPAIVTTTSLKRLKQLCAERAPDDEDGPEAAAAMRAWLERAKWGRGPGGMPMEGRYGRHVRRAYRHGIRNVCSARLIRRQSLAERVNY